MPSDEAIGARTALEQLGRYQLLCKLGNPRYQSRYARLGRICALTCARKYRTASKSAPRGIACRARIN